MKADLTRNTFNPFQHFNRVLMQQGRVQLDADWNEQAAILLHYLRALAADLIGPQGGLPPTGALPSSLLQRRSPGLPAISVLAWDAITSMAFSARRIAER